MLNGDSDPEGTVLVYTVTPVQSPDFGIATIDSAGNFTYVPLANFNGADTLVVQVCDSGTPLPAQCTLDTLVILVSAVNDAPYTQGDTASVMGGFSVSGDMMQNNTDIVEGTPLTASTIPVYGPSNGTIIINLDGTYTYTADSTFSGTDTVIVQICDSGLPLPPACTSDTLVITVNAAPFAANAGPDFDICDSSYTMQANIPNLGTGQWASVSGFGIPVNPTDPGTIINGLALGQNIFVWTITYNSIVTHDTVVITVIQPPSPAFAGFDQEVCGNTTLLQATAPIIGSGNWTILSGSGIIVLPGNPGSPVNSLGLGENRLIWQVTNSVCPSNADTVLIRTYTNPSVANAGSDIQVCADATSFNAVDPAVGQGWWQVLSGYGTIDSTTKANPSVSDLVPGESVFLWRVINGPCAASFDTLRVMRFEPPDAAFAGSDTSICATELQLTARIPSIGTGAWTGPGVFSPDIVSPLAKVSSLPVGLNTLTWVVSNGVCPESRDDIQVEVVLCDTGLFIPEGFSPNGDGVNDQFVISGAKGRRITLRIFNRWGSLVFESNDYQNNWDGNGGAGFSLGKELTEGTYYYVAEIEGLEARKGYLTLWK
jgi:gliding motility-associated-like protein